MMAEEKEQNYPQIVWNKEGIIRRLFGIKSELSTDYTDFTD
jgi:hypothetical protein